MAYFTNVVPKSKALGIPLNRNPRDIVKDAINKSFNDVPIAGLLLHANVTAYSHKVDKHWKHLLNTNETSVTDFTDELGTSFFRTSWVDLEQIEKECKVHATKKAEEALVVISALRDEVLADPQATEAEIETANLTVSKQTSFIAELDISITSCIYARPYPTHFVYRNFQETEGLAIFYNSIDKPSNYESEYIHNFNQLQINEEDATKVRYRLELSTGANLDWVEIDIPQSDTFHVTYILANSEYNTTTPVMLYSEDLPYLKELQETFTNPLDDTKYSPTMPIIQQGGIPEKNSDEFAMYEEALRLLYVNIYGLEEELLNRSIEQITEDPKALPLTNVFFQQGVSLQTPSNGGANYLHLWFKRLVDTGVTKKTFQEYENSIEPYKYTAPYMLQNIVTIEDSFAKRELKFNWVSSEIKEGTWEDDVDEEGLVNGKIPEPHNLNYCTVKLIESSGEQKEVVFQRNNFAISQNRQEALAPYSLYLLFGHHADPIKVNKDLIEIYKQISENEYEIITIEGFSIVTYLNYKAPLKAEEDPSWSVYTYKPSGYTEDPDELRFRPNTDVTEAWIRQYIADTDTATKKLRDVSNMIVPLTNFDITDEDSPFKYPECIAHPSFPFRLIEQCQQDSLHLQMFTEIPNEFIEPDGYYYSLFDSKVSENEYQWDEWGKFLNDMLDLNLSYYEQFAETDERYDEEDTSRFNFFFKTLLGINTLAYLPIPAKPEDSDELPAYFQGQSVMSKVMSGNLLFKPYSYDFEIINPLNTILTDIDYEEKTSMNERLNQEEDN